jgi:hypothetical protein
MRTTLLFVLLFVAVAGPLALHAACSLASLPALVLLERTLAHPEDYR